MKQYLILKDFKGSQDGLSDGEQFVAGAVAPLSDGLVAALGGVGGGFVKEVAQAAADIAAAPTGLADAVREAVEEASSVADRETKVEAPAETKVETPEEVKEETKPKKKGK